MFSKYKIVENGKEKTLILYFDCLYEFGMDNNNHHKYSSMKNEIKKIIKKINFTGEKVVLMIGGIILATILIVENPKVEDKLGLIYTSDNIILTTKLDANYPQKVVDKAIKEPILEIKNEENVEKYVEVSDIKNTIESSTIKNESKETLDKVEKVENDIKELILEKENLNDVEVTVYRKNGAILDLELEEYLIGVVGAEMPASFDIEALKAQAIISRTYALRSIEIDRKLTDDVKTQVYKDNDELKMQWGNSYDKYYNKIKEAAYSTKGLAIYYDNNLIDALFFSTSNGKTEDSKYVWGKEIPYLKSVDSSWDKESSTYLREIDKDLANVLDILGINTTDFTIVSRNESGRVLEIKIGEKSYTGVEFRNLLGLRSTDFDIEINGDTIKFITRGYGHGVGLSQYGANGMAKQGYNFQDIVKHYYLGVEIK